MGVPLAQAITYVETPAGAMMSAGWFWDRNNLSLLADAEDYAKAVTSIPKRINGGLNGAEDRLKKCNCVRRALIFAA